VERICDRSSGGLRPVSSQEEEIKVIKSNIEININRIKFDDNCGG